MYTPINSHFRFSNHNRMPGRTATDEAREMDVLNEVLAVVVEEAVFDLETTEIGAGGSYLRPSHQRVSASQLHEVYHRESARIVRLHVRATVSEESMPRLEDVLRRTLEQFIDQDSDRVGHAFPVENGSGGGTRYRTTHGSDGLCHEEFSSSVNDFAIALVRAAALVGVEKAVGLLGEWKRGTPLGLYMATVLNGLPLAASVSPREDIQLLPLPLTTSELPRLPVRREAGPRDYLGLTLLTVRLDASPALFRPDPDGQEQIVRSCSVEGVNLDTVCESLSLQTGRYVSKSFICTIMRTRRYFAWGIRRLGR